jgi:Tfp pilus assembly protein PilX
LYEGKKTVNSSPISDHQQRGAAALIVAFGLSCALLLTVVFTHRNLVFAKRSSVNQQQSGVAYEAAEAGLNWAQAMLNQADAINARCERLGATHASVISKTARSFAQAHAEDGAATIAARCVRTADAWACYCAGADPERPDGTQQQAAFSLQIKAVAADMGKPAALQVSATGCHGAQMPCTAHVNTAMEETAQVRLQVQFERIGGLQPGVTQAITLRDRAQTAAAFFARHFGLDKSTWQKQPAVNTVRCKESNCLETLSKTLAATVEPTLIWIEGDVVLDASGTHSALHPALLGSEERPVTLVVQNRLTLRGPLHLHGVLYAASLESPSAVMTADGITPTVLEADAPLVYGTVLAEDSVSLRPSQVILNNDVLDRLQTQTGTFARVPGSWKDF